MANKVVICGIDTSSLPKCTNEKSNELLAKIKQGVDGAQEEFIMLNIRLVLSIIQRFNIKTDTADDIFQVGMIGLLKSIENFDLSLGVKFSTYAVPMIAGEIKRFLRDDGSVKVSRSIKGQYYNMQKYIEEYRSKTGSSPTIKEISDKFNIEEPEVMFVLESSKMPVSIYENLDKESNSGQTILDKLVNFDEVSTLVDRMVLKDALIDLEDKDRKLIMLRYFRDKTQSEVAQILNVSQVQVSRLENKILAKMRNKLRD